MEEAAVHLVQRLLPLRENKGFGSEACRAEDFRRRVSVVRRSAASDLVHESPQNLVSSFPLHQVFGVQFSVYDVTWCFTPRNPLFLRPEAPRPQVRMGLCRHGRGASSPAIPCSFVRKHHVTQLGWAAAGTDVVLHSPQSLISSSGSTTSSGPDGPLPTWTWCSIPRNPLFLRPEAPRPQVRMSLCRHGRGAPYPAIPYSFVEGHHVPGPG